MDNDNIKHDVKSFIDLMNLDELIRLNTYIVKRIRFFQELDTMEEVQNFELLERVYFIDNEGNRIEGTIIRLNRKSVTIRTDTGSEWRVSPQFLKINTRD